MFDSRIFRLPSMSSQLSEECTLRGVLHNKLTEIRNSINSQKRKVTILSIFVIVVIILILHSPGERALSQS